MVTTIGPIVGGVVGAFFHDYVMRPNIPGAMRELVHRVSGKVAEQQPVEV